MNYQEFFEEAAQLHVRLTDDAAEGRPIAALSNEALFQLPFLAMTILVLAKGRNKPELSEVGQIVGECLERSIPGFKGSSQGIGWSANLRIRTVKALTFLESVNLVTLSRTKAISASERGRAVVERAIDQEGRLSMALLTIERNYQNIEAETRLNLRLL